MAESLGKRKVIEKFHEKGKGLSIEQVIQRIGGLFYCWMAIAGSRFNGVVPHQLAKRLDLLPGMGGVGMA